MTDIVENTYKQLNDLLEYLEKQGEVSLKSDADNNLKKDLLLTAASYFEYQIRNIILSFVSKITNNNALIYSFVHKKALDRQFHTLFDFDANNVNHFLNFFGKEFKEKVQGEIRGNPSLDKGIKSFLYICGTRNEAIHDNFGLYMIDKTSEDIFVEYKNGLIFIELLSKHLS